MLYKILSAVLSEPFSEDFFINNYKYFHLCRW